MSLFYCVASCAILSFLGIAQDDYDCAGETCPGDQVMLLARNVKTLEQLSKGASDADGQHLEIFEEEPQKLNNLSEAPAIEMALYARNTSDDISFLDATEKYEAGEWVDLESKNSCQVVNYEYQWFGKAPWCAASSRDCTDDGMEYVRSGRHGSKCWRGTKVLCRRKKVVKSDDCNIWCNPGHFSYSMYGTAPFCKGEDCSCWRQGQIPIGQAKQFTCPCHDRKKCPSLETRGNSKCWTGYKQFCVRPTFKQNFNLDAVKSCDFRYGEAQKTKRAAMDMVGKLAEAGSKAAVAAYGAR